MCVRILNPTYEEGRFRPGLTSCMQARVELVSHTALYLGGALGACGPPDVSPLLPISDNYE